VLRRMPSFMLLDDHEIDDNWEPLASPDEKTNDEKKQHGVKAYKKYQRGRNGGLETFDFDGFHFFMLDTRTERMHRKVDGSLASANLFNSDMSDPSKTMGRLKKWLLEKPAPKFVVSPAMLLPRHRRAVQCDSNLDPSNLSALHSDGWDGYPNTLREVLAYIAKEGIKGVVFLSGDEHRGCVATVDLCDADGNPITRVHSLHTAAVYAPYPFANSLDEDVVASETIVIADPNYGNYQCVVNTTRPPAGDGVTFLRVRQVGTAWKLDYEFADGMVQTLTL
jgi:cholesterol oxidase